MEEEKMGIECQEEDDDDRDEKIKTLDSPSLTKK